MAQRETSRISGTLRLKLDRGIEHGRPIALGAGAERYELPQNLILNAPPNMAFDVIVSASLNRVWQLIKDAGLADRCRASSRDGTGGLDDCLWTIKCPTERAKLRLIRQASLNCVQIIVQERPPWA